MSGNVSPVSFVECGNLSNKRGNCSSLIWLQFLQDRVVSALLAEVSFQFEFVVLVASRVTPGTSSLQLSGHVVDVALVSISVVIIAAGPNSIMDYRWLSEIEGGLGLSLWQKL